MEKHLLLAGDNFKMTHKGEQSLCQFKAKLINPR
jgi:hypothetical protein